MDRRHISLAAAALAALLLPSCVQWNIGKNIRESSLTYVGADMRERYVAPKGADYGSWPPRGGKSWPCLAAEVSYRPDYPLVSDSWCNLPRAREGSVKPTGAYRKVVVHALRIIQGNEVSVGGRFEAGAAPLTPLTRGQQRWQQDDCPVRPAEPRVLERGTWYPLAAVAAAPFDYLIDPALSVVTTPLYWAGCLAARPFVQHGQSAAAAEASNPVANE